MPYGATSGDNQAIGAVIVGIEQSEAKNQVEVAVRANIEDSSFFDFCIAIFFIVFGMLSLDAGLVSCFVGGTLLSAYYFDSSR